MADESKTVVVETVDQLLQPKTRRSFLRLAALGGTAVLLPGLFAACGDDDDEPRAGSYTLNLGSEVGYLQYAHALEQLEAAFYTAAVNSPYSGITAAETSILADIRNHEVIHRNALSTILGSNAVPALAVNFTAINFGVRTNGSTGALDAAKTFEDTGVGAYNGAGQFLKNADNLTLAGKIVSVEARHAAIIRDLLDTTGTLFAGDDIVDANGLDTSLTASTVLGRVDPYVVTAITVQSCSGRQETYLP
jgi:hypothetical protein